MSVYTQLDQNDFEYICDQFQLGQLIEFTGVADGIENTTYFFTVQSQNTTSEWVFTLFEYTDKSTLPYYLALYEHLYQQGVAVPQPQLTNNQQRLITLHNKPGAVFPRLPGRPPKQLNAELCFQCGQALARFHLAGMSYRDRHDCPKGLLFWQTSIERFPQLTEEDKHLIETVITRYQTVINDLPKTSVHGDLFHDNVLVDQGRITAIIDLFNASFDFAVMDLAITLNDWTIDSNTHQKDLALQLAMIEGYQSVRPLSDNEHRALPIMQQAAALRFWLSRIDTAQAFSEHSDNHAISSKDPDQMKSLLISLM